MRRSPGLAPAAVGRDAAERHARRVEAATHEPLFTNYGADFSGTLDYLFYTANSLQPTMLLELPDKGDVQVNAHAMPTPTPHPSPNPNPKYLSFRPPNPTLTQP